jgi:hypothetical protein
MMNLNGRGLRDHIRLVAPLCGVIAAVFVLREVSYAAGVPRGLVRAISVTVAVHACLLLAVLIIHIRRFGSYSNVILADLLLVVWGQLLMVAAIVFSAFTGIQTVYSTPGYTFGEMSPWKRIAGHLTFEVGIGTISGAAMGCLLLWMMRKFPPDPTQVKHK